MLPFLRPFTHPPHSPSNAGGLSANDLGTSFLESGADAFAMKPFPCKKDALVKELHRILGDDIEQATDDGNSTQAAVDNPLSIAKTNTVNNEEGKSVTLAVEESEPATPTVVEESEPATPVVEESKPATPVVEASKPAIPVGQPSVSTLDVVEVKNEVPPELVDSSIYHEVNAMFAEADHLIKSIMKDDPSTTDTTRRPSSEDDSEGDEFLC